MWLWYIQCTCQTELQEVWTGTATLGVVSSDIIFKAMKLDEFSQQEWAERLHDQIPSSEKYTEIRGIE